MNLNTMNKSMNQWVWCAVLMALGMVAAQAQTKDVVTRDYATTVERMFNLNKGMTLQDVNATLMCEPNAILQNTKDGYLFLEYLYMHRKREVKSGQENTDAHRLNGSPSYFEMSKMYAMFDNDQKLVQYVTEGAMGELKDLYATEATATILGSYNSPCASNCVILRPGEQLVPMAEAEEEVEEEEEAPAGRFGNALGGLGGGLLGQAMDKAAAVADGNDDAPVGCEDCGYAVGSQVNVPSVYGPLAGEVIALLPTMSGCSAIVKYTIDGELMTSTVDVSNLTLRTSDEVYGE